MNIISAITFDISKIDGNAMTIFIIGFGIVFAVLLVIYSIFYMMPKVLSIKLKKKSPKEESQVISKIESESTSNNEDFVAIAMALGLYFEDIHDDEPMILNIRLEERINSHWNSKIQNVNFYNN